MSRKRHYRKVLTIAGSDSGGGAGIQADIKTISACGCYAMSAITAITAQNTLGVTDVHAVPASTVRAQITSVLGDIGADAVKIGMLLSPEIIAAVAESLKAHEASHIVLDPVMVAKSGDRLLQDEAIETLDRCLVPQVRLITPNIPEAEILLGRKVRSQDDMASMAEEISGGRGVSVLLKGGHLSGSELVDTLYSAPEGRVTEFRSERISTGNTHGTGCTLSSAAASFLARGLSLERAVASACEYVHRAIVAGADYTTGEGHGPVHHFFDFWGPEQ